MFHSNQRRQNLAQGIFSLWANWAVAVGLVILPITLTPIVPPGLLPVVPLLSAGVITILDRRNRMQQSPTCFRIPQLVQGILVISAIIMFVDLFIKLHSDINGILGQPVNRTTPLLPVLDIAPVAALVCLFNMLHLHNPRSCRSCRNRFGESMDRGLIGMLYSRESKIQIKSLFLISSLLAVASWVYYIIGYVTVNISKTDSYLFILCPVLCYALSLIYFGMRYYTLWVYYCQNNETAKVIDRQGTTIRYIVVCDDKLLLNIPPQTNDIIFSEDLKIDVPLKVSLPFREKVTEHDAHRYFIDASELKEADTRPIYTTCDPGMYKNVFHYVAFVNDADKTAETLKGQWFTLQETNEMIREGMVSMTLASELSRIYTITMAWKAYDRSGHRLYEIKHYRPTFRLKDMHKWNVDYNDSTWLHVAEINEDKPFFRIRRFWHRLTKGIK